MDCPPLALPISINAPVISDNSPRPFQNFCQPVASIGRLLRAPRYTAVITSRAPLINRMAQPGRMRSSIHIAKASSITPKKALIFSIQRPALGSRVPAEVPIISNGIPMPILIANNAAPPRTGSAC